MDKEGILELSQFHLVFAPLQLSSKSLLWLSKRGKDFVTVGKIEMAVQL